MGFSKETLIFIAEKLVIFKSPKSRKSAIVGISVERVIEFEKGERGSRLRVTSKRNGNQPDRRENVNIPPWRILK